MIGWASVPYDSHWALRHPKRAAGMSLAGPAANLCLVLISALAIRVGLAYGVFHSPESIYTTSVVEAALARQRGETAEMARYGRAPCARHLAWPSSTGQS